MCGGVLVMAVNRGVVLGVESESLEELASSNLVCGKLCGLTWFLVD